ncbi:hypothetical protein ACFVVL_27235 [Kitasatospora sp. NPDC058115]|uniref:hypothetical protein n=1 Tax=Kitasatospora sp. NPDC058115 TaxID=3346347 RepID=UPI0036DA6A7B
MTDTDSWRLNPTDEMLHHSAHTLGSTRIVQVLWHTPRPLPAHALDDLWHHLNHGLLSRRAHHPRLPGARRAWKPATNTDPPHHQTHPLTHTTAPDWIDDQIRIPLPAGSTRLWHLASAPYDGGHLISLTVPHFLSDGLGILNALATTTRAHPPTGPRHSDTADALRQITRAARHTARWTLHLATDPHLRTTLTTALHPTTNNTTATGAANSAANGTAADAAGTAANGTANRTDGTVSGTANGAANGTDGTVSGTANGAANGTDGTVSGTASGTTDGTDGTTDGTASGTAGGAGGGSQPRFFTTAVLDIDAHAWEERARAHGGTVNSLFLEIAANLLRARLPHAAHHGLTLGIPMNLRRADGDERANALVVLPLPLPGGPPHHDDLHPTRRATKHLLQTSATHRTTLVPEPLWHLLPEHLATRLKNPGAQQTDAVASNFGDIPDAVARCAGPTATRVALRTMNVPGLIPERARLRASLCLARLGPRMTLTVTAMPDHFGTRDHLHHLVTEELTAWGLTAQPWWPAPPPTTKEN